MVKTDKSLTWEENKFIYNYLQTGDTAEASITAGYDRKTKTGHQINGDRLLSQGNVQKELLPLAKQDALEIIAKVEALVFKIIDINDVENIVKFNVELNRIIEDASQKYAGKSIKKIVGAYEKNEINIIKRIMLED